MRIKVKNMLNFMDCTYVCYHITVLVIQFLTYILKLNSVDSGMIKAE